MAHHFREPERRQPLLLPADMMDWLPAGDIVHLIVDAVSLIYAYSHGIRSSRVIERLCGRDAGYRFIVGDAIPDHTVIARFRQRHVARMREVFLVVLRLCREAGLVRLGRVALDGTKVRANAALDANRTASSLDEQVAEMLAEAEAADTQEDRQFGVQRGEELPAALALRASVEPAIGQMKDCQGARRFSMRGLERCRGEWLFAVRADFGQRRAPLRRTIISCVHPAAMALPAGRVPPSHTLRSSKLP